jgi:hypothetical protein
MAALATSSVAEKQSAPGFDSAMVERFRHPKRL